MALKIDLKPHERLIVGGAVISNSNSKCSFVVENNVALLREREILKEKEADTPCKRVYFMVQLMYVDDKNLVEKHNLYWTLARDVVQAAPSTAPLISDISTQVLSGHYYQALKLAKKLIRYEEEVTRNARTGAQRI